MNEPEQIRDVQETPKLASDPERPMSPQEAYWRHKIAETGQWLDEAIERAKQHEDRPETRQDAPSEAHEPPTTTSQTQSLYQDAHKPLETVLATPEPPTSSYVPPEPDSARWWRDVAAEAARQLKAREEELQEARGQLAEAGDLLEEYKALGEAVETYRRAKQAAWAGVFSPDAKLWDEQNKAEAAMFAAADLIKTLPEKG